MKIGQIRMLNRLDEESTKQIGEITRLIQLIHELQQRIDKLEQKPKRGRPAKNAKTI